MQRTIVLSVAASSLVSVLLTMLVMTLALPGLADAQAARIRAEQFTIVGENGADRIQLLKSGRMAPIVSNYRRARGWAQPCGCSIPRAGLA